MSLCKKLGHPNQLTRSWPVIFPVACDRGIGNSSLKRQQDKRQENQQLGRTETLLGPHGGGEGGAQPLSVPRGRKAAGQRRSSKPAKQAGLGEGREPAILRSKERYLEMLEEGGSKRTLNSMKKI